ncbi:ABC transporter ATP-binding protein [Streptomyces sp. HNM0575]|uniref:ABC transporter ATP-binding protein n=1 Tax=Streptomyces sp. HNM0575 TaxID=2716338 RepID=UPI00145E3941|nr:ABC transporter ATP-binding protein [Streptomyces sp. HNM0575]NLU72107.1 ABC transporter ATP-binding protein [Streptomyces sp. HNM0575]
MTRQHSPVVEFAGVSKSYGSVRALADLTVRLHPGETVALLGPNGAGKSTTLDLLLGLRSPDPGGMVRLFGTSPRKAVTESRVGAMLQSGGLMEGVKVRELVGLACDLHPRAHPVEKVLADAGITAIADRMVCKLSGGQEQRVRFALAVAGESDLIVLDEPTTGMDVSARGHFWKAMREQAAQGRTVLFATHYLEEADAVADRVLVLHRGRLLADGTAADIKNRAGARRISFALRSGPASGPANGTANSTVNGTGNGLGNGSGSGTGDRSNGYKAAAETEVRAHEPALRALPGVTEFEVAGGTVRMRSADADATVHALYGLGLYPRDLEVTHLGLEQAFLAITKDAEEQHEQQHERQDAGRGPGGDGGEVAAPRKDHDDTEVAAV